MPSLSDKLKSLGVQVGASNLPPARPRTANALEGILGGAPIQTPQGETFVVEAHYPPGHNHGLGELALKSPLQTMAAWAGETRIAEMPTQAFAFLDTETTGLSGGTGTYAFLIGVARFEDNETLHLAQFFMRDPLEEPAQLAALEEFLAPCQAIVTFNGKAFDIPLLQTRFTVHGWRSPFAELAHVDLLHLARRLWRERLPSRTLANLEVQILGGERSQEDVPGWMIPSIYMDYLRSGDPTPLKSVFYHNAMDVVSLAALLEHTAALLSNPVEKAAQHGVDLIALARLFEDLGDLQAAVRLYIHGLEHDDVQAERLPRGVLLGAIERLALIHKRQQEWPAALELWEQAAYHQHLPAFVELAKYYEHRVQDYPQAIHWTQAALDLAGDASHNLPLYERRQWQEELLHRIQRLQHKDSNSGNNDPSIGRRNSSG